MFDFSCETHGMAASLAQSFKLFVRWACNNYIMCD